MPKSAVFIWQCAIISHQNKVILKVQHITVKKVHFLGISRAGKNLIVVSAVSCLGYM